MTIGNYKLRQAQHSLLDECCAFLFMLQRILIFLIVFISVFSSLAQNTDINSLCPIKRFIDCKSPLEFSQKFQGDTILFSVPSIEEVYFETFKLVVPDTLWLKERPKNKIPQQYKHFKLINNFRPVSGWGVNAHRQYTPSSTLEKCKFVLRGTHSEEIQYLGKFNYILLQDVASGKLIKWDYTKNENNGLLIFSPSILRHLSLMKGLDCLLFDNDTTLVPAKCNDTAFSILVNHKQFLITVDADFSTDKGNRISHNWEPMFFLKKDEDKLRNNRQTQ